MLDYHKELLLLYLHRAHTIEQLNRLENRQRNDSSNGRSHVKYQILNPLLFSDASSQNDVQGRLEASFLLQTEAHLLWLPPPFLAMWLGIWDQSDQSFYFHWIFYFSAASRR